MTMDLSPRLLGLTLLISITTSTLPALETVEPEAIIKPENSTWLQFGSAMAIDDGWVAIAMPGMEVDGEAFRGGVGLYKFCAGKSIEPLASVAHRGSPVDLDTRSFNGAPGRRIDQLDLALG